MGVVAGFVVVGAVVGTVVTVVGAVVGAVVAEQDGTVVTVVGTVVPIVGVVVTTVDGTVVTCITGSVVSFPAPGHSSIITTAKSAIPPSTNSHPLGRRLTDGIVSFSESGVMQ